MEDLHSLLNKQRPTEPEDFTKLKNYIKDKYNVLVSIRQDKSGLVVAVPNAPLAATLQMEKILIIESCNISQNLRFEIKA